MSSPNDPDGAVTEHAVPSSGPVRYRIRTAPRFGPFLATGALLGLVVGVLIDLLGPDAPQVDSVSSLGFFAVAGAFLGALLAAVVAVLLEQRS